MFTSRGFYTSGVGVDTAVISVEINVYGNRPLLALGGISPQNGFDSDVLLKYEDTVVFKTGFIRD